MPHDTEQEIDSTEQEALTRESHPESQSHSDIYRIGKKKHVSLQGCN